MRGILVAAVMVAAAHGAHAADMPEFGALRGAVVDTPPGVVNWQGFYVGGQGGYGTSDMDFTNSTSNIASRMMALTTIENEYQVSQWPVLGKRSAQGSGYGGFVGYNWQWDDVILGLEANYMHGNFGGSDSGSMGRSFTTSDGYTNGVTYRASANMQVKDVGSVRARAGWAIGSFLPYAFGGIALGQADIIRSASISGTAVNANAAPGFQTINFAYNKTEQMNSHFIYGYSAGLGMDMMLYRGLFLRAEWEYQKFAAPINTAVSTVRGGLGYKF
ncbi:outer membrane beta-barrel protein [Rhodopseudomonas palustris]|jgi:outer membrane immunogenic protein|uniref:outer membrane protein n=1 Tax=Rhodopseudomonas palustris TaxID=1076 RepID=UPI0020CE1EC8|nr:outer membrane beta-barrel protein [Rhodopseudomonas palustris]MCP9629645.1 outer membrane beta-barrel protein [Rhodopseudomonas palustris]